MTTLLTIEEAAERLKLSPRTVREWLRVGKLRGVKAGKNWRVREQDLETFIHEHLRDGELGEGAPHDTR